MKVSQVDQLDFVGRQAQLQNIQEVIEKRNRRYLVSIQGQGGAGKTYLLRKIFGEYHNSEEPFCFAIVDFSQSRTRTRRWLMDFIAGQTWGEFDQYYKVKQASTGRNGSRIEKPLNLEELEAAFRADFLAFERQKRCIFLFDTLELIQDTFLLDFLIDMAKIAQNTVFVLAGRRNYELGDRFQNTFEPGRVETIALVGFDEPDAMDYIERHPGGKDLLDDDKRVLYLLTNKGIPIKLALALDWLSRGLVMQTMIEYSLYELRQLEKRQNDNFQQIVLDFDRELVTQIAELGTDVDQAIHLMAHVHKRFNRALLERLLPDADPKELLNQIRALPFVKFIEDDYFVLHDEVQRMVVKHVWEAQDPTFEKRREISQQVLAYYDDELAQLDSQALAEEGLSQDDQREYRIYEIERLHYQLDIDLQDGYHNFCHLFEELEDRRNIELAALALDVLIKNRPLPPRLRVFVETYYDGWVLVRRQYLEQAQKHLEQGLEQLSAKTSDEANAELKQFVEREVDQRIGEVYTLLGYNHRLLGDWTEGIDYYRKARDMNKMLINELQEAEASPELVKRSIGRLAETLNDLANLQRMRGDLDQARRNCKMSLLIREKLGDLRTVGHSCYVMGMIMWESGNTSEAINYLNQARRHYQSATEETLERAWVDRYEGLIMFRTGNVQEALKLLYRTLEATSDNPNLQEEYSATLLHLSRIHREQGPDGRQNALKEAETALGIARRIRSDYRIVEGHLTICLTLKAMLKDDKSRADGLWPRFYEHLEAGRGLAQKRQYRLLEYVFAGLEADLAYEDKDYLLAFEKYTLACQRATQFKPAVFARAMSNLGEHLYYLVNEHPDQTIGICKQIMHQWGSGDKLTENYPEFKDEVDYIQKIAEDAILWQQRNRSFEAKLRHGSWDEALRICDKADAIPIHNHPNRPKIFYNRAEAYHGANKFSPAQLYCERAMRSQRTTGADPESLANSYLLLSRIYWKLGNTAESANALNLAEEQYQLANSEVGSGLLELDRATIFFRTHQFSRARESLIKARDIFEKTNEPVFLASTLNVMSRLDRVDPSLAAYEEVGYDEADRRGREALQVLDNRDWFVAAELNLTLCILHYAWGLKLINKGQKEEADEHFKLSSDFNRQGLDKIEQIDSPMLYSIYRGMQANLAIQAGDQKTAAEHFLNELMSATQTKHMRLLRALDLLESWLVSMPPGETDRIGQWLVKNWRKKGLSNNFPQVEEAIQQVADYRSYIPNTV